MKNFKFRYPKIPVIAIPLITGWLLALLYGLDPSGNSWGAGNIPSLKYLPTVIGLFSILLYVVVKGKIRWRQTINNTAIFLFATFVLAGSVYALWQIGRPLPSTFMGLGINALVFFSGYYVFYVIPPNTQEIVWDYLGVISFLSAVWISISLLIRVFGIGLTAPITLYHEEFFLVPSAVLWVTNRKKIFVNLNASIVIIILGGLTGKYTGFMTSVIVSLYLLWQVWQAGKERKNFIIRILSLWLVGLFLATAIFVAIKTPSSLPTGSPGVRLVTYQQRLTEFIQQPFVGQMFSGSAEFVLPTKDGEVTLPSHSDFLDIASQGGLVGLLLFFIPVLNVCRNALPKIISGQWTRYNEFAFFLMFTFLSMAAFNPVLKQPGLAYFFWLPLGYLCAQEVKNINP